MIKFIYFDFGGIFVNYDNALLGVSQKFGLDLDKLLGYYDQFSDDLNCGRISTSEFIEKTKEHFKVKNVEGFDFYRSWVEDYKVILPMHELVTGLQGMINMGIISNISSGLWEASIKYGLAPSIAYKKVLLSYELGMKKPDPRVFELAQKESGVMPEEILFVDDQEKNLGVPREMGWETVLFDQYKAKEGVEEIKGKLK